MKYHLRRGVGFIKFLENGTRPQPPTSRGLSEWMFSKTPKGNSLLKCLSVCVSTWRFNVSDPYACRIVSDVCMCLLICQWCMYVPVDMSVMYVCACRNVRDVSMCASKCPWYIRMPVCLPSVSTSSFFCDTLPTSGLCKSIFSKTQKVNSILKFL